MPDASRQQGTALLSTILGVAFLVMVGALAAGQARISLLLDQRTREGLEAFVAAETALAGAQADFAREPTFERLERAAGLPFPFLGEPPDGRLPDSFEVEVHIDPVSDGIVDIAAKALGRNRASRRLHWTVARLPAPFVPAALHTTAASPWIRGGPGLSVRGGSDVPALALTDQKASQAVYDALIASGATIDGSPAATGRRWSRIAVALDRLRSTAANELPTVIGGTFAETVAIARQSSEITNARGAGLWLIDGDLHIHSVLEFTGLLIIAGDLRIPTDATVAVAGSLLQAEPGSVIDSQGTLDVRYDLAAIARIDALAPDLLDRSTTVLGWRDDS